MGNAYDNASLLVTPNGYKASKIYSAKPTDGSGDLTFSRASTAMRRNSAGLWESVASNVPRLQYPVGGGCPSWLFEAQDTNSLLYSTDFSNAAWAAIGTATKNPSALPTNIKDVVPYDIAGLGAAGVNFFYQSLGSNTDVYYKVFIRATVVGDVGKTIRLTSNAGLSVSITLTEAWQEYSVFASGSGNNQLMLSTGVTGTPATACTISYCGIHTTNSTSPIITAGSAVTRLADAATKSTISSLIGQTEGTLFVDFIGTQDRQAAAKFLMQIGGSKTIGITTFSSVIDIIGGGGGASFSYTSGLQYKVAVCYNNNGNFRVFVNGAKTNELNTYASGTYADLGIGSRTGGDISANTTIKEAIIYTTALSDSEAIELTTL